MRNSPDRNPTRNSRNQTSVAVGAVCEELDGLAAPRPIQPSPIPGHWIVGDVARWLREDPLPTRWVVAGLVPAGVHGVFAACAGAGKSMTSLLMAMGVATGRGLYGRSASPGVPQGVIFVSMEDSEDEFHGRVRRGKKLMMAAGAWSGQDDARLARNLKPAFPDHVTGAGFKLEDQWQNIRDLALEIPGGCGLIVLDTLSALSNGDQNSADGMQPFMAAAESLAKTTGATVLTLHHIGKGNGINSNKSLAIRLGTEALRGSSAIVASARFVITMAEPTEGDARRGGLDFDLAKQGGYEVVCLAKNNQGKKGFSMLLERQDDNAAGAGFLALHGRSDEALAAILGVKPAAPKQLTKRDRVLLALAVAGDMPKADQAAAASKIWPEGQNPLALWLTQLTHLRTAKLLESDGRRLTTAGLDLAKTLGFTFV